jgi:DnaD/phage-associated family protein
MHELFKLEQFSRDSFRVKRTYIDICGDLIAGILLGQIVYWFMPNEHGKSKLRVWKDGELWLAKGRDDWWKEIRITAKQFDRAIKILENKGFVTTKKFKFNGAPTIHIRLNIDKVMEAIDSILTDGENENSPDDEIQIDQTVNSISTIGENGFLPKGKIQITEKGKTLTEITTDITTENTTSLVEELEQVSHFYQNHFGPPSPYVAESMIKWTNTLSPELVIEALKITYKEGKKWKYTEGILNNWLKDGITSLNDLEKQKEKKSAPRRRKSDIAALKNLIENMEDE